MIYRASSVVILLAAVGLSGFAQPDAIGSAPMLRPVIREVTDAGLQLPAGGRLVRICGFDLRKPGAKWCGDGRWEMVYEPDYQGLPCYRLQIKDKQQDPFTDWSASAQHTLPLLPNRSYLMSVLVNSRFKRPAEVNIGLKMIDAEGRQVIWNFNGLPNDTHGWQRWEWEITTDPRTTHGVFSILITSFPLDGELRLGDVAFIELPPRKLKPYAKGEGATFRGGPGALPMRIEQATNQNGTLQVRTTGARYTFDLEKNTILAEQLIGRQREIALWSCSVSLAGLQVLRHTAKECVVANDHVTFGVQCDSLMMVVPHEELVLTCNSKIGGKWNRLQAGHLLVADDHGGMAVNPDIPAGTGRCARLHIDSYWHGIRLGRTPPGAVDFAGTAGNQTFISQARPGWTISWLISPGERLAISVFPPRPYPWKDSFDFAWLLTFRKDPLDIYPADIRGPYHVYLLWDFFQRAWGMSWGPKYIPYDEADLRAHIAAIKKAGAYPICYASAQWYYSRDPAEFANEIKRLRDTYGLEGIYYDGIPSQPWVVAYEEMRMTRELFPDGPVILHNTGNAYNGNPPLGEPSIRIPAVETYATATYTAEGVYGTGADWPLVRYMASQYHVANCIGVMVYGQAWQGLDRLQKELILLRYNGRCQYRKYPPQYYSILLQLKKLWQEKGAEPDFYEKYYLPKWEELTKGLLP